MNIHEFFMVTKKFRMSATKQLRIEHEGILLMPKVLGKVVSIIEGK